MNEFQTDNTQAQDIRLADYFRIIMQYRLIVILVFLFMVLAAFVATIRSPKIYRASTRILMETQQQSMFMLQAQASDNSVNNQMEILRSRYVVDKAVGLLQKHEDYNDLPIAALTDPGSGILGRVSVDTKRETDIVSISCESTNPKETQYIANAMAYALIEQNTANARTELTAIRQFLEDQLELKTRILRNSEDDLRRYKLDQGITVLSEETTQLIQHAADVESDLKLAETDLEIADQSLNYFYRELGRQDSLLLNVNSLLTSPLLDKLRSDIVDAQTRQSRLLAKPNYDMNHPELEALNKEIENSKTQLNEEVKRLVKVRIGSTDPLAYRSDLIQRIATTHIDRTVAQSKVAGLKEAIEQYNKQLRLLPDTELELARLQRAYEMNERVQSMLTEKYEDAKISEQAKMGAIRMVDEATLPTSPIKPRKMVNMLIGLMLGLVGGIGAAFIYHSLDIKLRTLDDMENYVRSPILGTIPYIHVSESDIEELEGMIQKSEGEEKKQLQMSQYNMIARLITFYAPKSPVAEAYRTLRTNLISKRPKEGPLTVLITSSGPREGKSTSNANLAIALAKMEAKVVLIDLDLRRPMIHNLFNRKKERGCSEFLIDTDTKLDDIVKQTHIPNLDVITSGLVPPNPSEIISSKRMDEFFDALRAKYDYILIDSPPIIAVTDALIIAKKVDMIVLVVRVGVTDRQIIKRTNEILSTVDIKLTGAIVNGIEVQKYYSGYGYYYYYYYYYYYNSKTDKKGAAGQKGKGKDQQLPGGVA
jgi:polysaccharide biosynthesis transport protein